MGESKLTSLYLWTLEMVWTKHIKKLTSLHAGWWRKLCSKWVCRPSWRIWQGV